MTREILSVHTRCRTCGMATVFVVSTTDLDDEGQVMVVIAPEPVPHSAQECKAFDALQRETWPRLW